MNATRYFDAPRIDGVHIEGPLGWGGQADVWKGRTDAGAHVVVKVIPKAAIPRSTHARRLKALAKAGGDHLARVLAAHEHPTCFYLISEFVTGPALATVRTGGGGLSRAEGWRVLADLCAGLAELHRVGVVHGDVSPANVLMRSDRGHARPVLIDLGGSDEWELGTVGFRAPELSQGHAPSAAADVWSAAKVATWAVADDERWQFAAEIGAGLDEDPTRRPRAEDLCAVAETHASPAVTLPEPARLAGAQLRAQCEHEPTRMARRGRNRPGARDLVRPNRSHHERRHRERRHRERRHRARPARDSRPMRGPRHGRARTASPRAVAVAVALVLAVLLGGRLASSSVTAIQGQPSAQSRAESEDPTWVIPGLDIDPAETALALTATRDAALSAGDGGALQEVTVPGSPPAIADAGLLHAFKGATPSRLSTHARVLAVAGNARGPIVTLELTQTGFTWEGGARSGVTVSGTPPRCAEMHLVEYEGSWRVADVQRCVLPVQASD